MHIERTYAIRNTIRLTVTHIRPCENGYSKDYGFPQTEELVRDGFEDEFWLEGSRLGERFKDSPLHGVPHGFYDEHRYVEYWDYDPYGWADRAAENHYDL